MCGRMALTLPMDAMAQLFAATPDNALPEVPNYNVCPTTQVPLVTGASEDESRRLRGGRWGFIPHWYKKPGGGPLLINARAETLAEKPAFRSAARARRGLVIASGFYEWTKDADGGRDPWYIKRADGAALAMAAIWQDWTGQDGTSVTTCAVVTTASNAGISAIHHRMPLILDPQDWPMWLGEAGKGAATLMVPGAEGTLHWHRVDRTVNSNRASGPDLIEPI